MTTSEAPQRGRGTAIGEGITWTARWSLRLILVSAGAVLIWLLIGALWSIVMPVFLAVILRDGAVAAHRVAAPPPLPAGAGRGRRGARRHLVLAGLVTLITTSVVGQHPGDRARARRAVSRPSSSGCPARR